MPQDAVVVTLVVLSQHQQNVVHLLAPNPISFCSNWYYLMAFFSQIPHPFRGRVFLSTMKTSQDETRNVVIPVDKLLALGKTFLDSRLSHEEFDSTLDRLKINELEQFHLLFKSLMEDQKWRDACFAQKRSTIIPPEFPLSQKAPDFQ